MKKIKYFITILFLFIGLLSNAQNLIWTGKASNNNFFDEGNWQISTTNVAPISGTIDPGIAINLPMQINNVTAEINATGEINLGTGSLSITMANITAQSISGAGGSLIINEGAYVELADTTPFKSTTPKVQINFTSGLCWIKTTNYSPRLISISNVGQIKVNGANSVYKTNLRLDNYYLKGCVIRPNQSTTTPLTVYDGTNLQGNAAQITVNTIHSADAIANSMNNKIESFILKKGFMATFADEADGTGSSKNYIASESDLIINTFPKLLQNSISFIRVLPWNWVTKKGRTGTGTDLNTSWRYNWSNGDSSTIDIEQAPMAFTGFNADDDADIALYVGKYNSTHVMAFNEADNCFDQAGQYGNPKLCETDEAVRIYKNLMKTGMRLVSPSGTEGAATGWLKEFHKKATAQNIRIDVIGVHWYDWGSNPKSNPNPTAQQVFNRFKTYLTTVHNLYGLPIWITEFNANPYRSTAIQQGFMELALPYLETLSYVERYNWFQPNPTPEDDTDNANKVGTGEFYTTRPPGLSPVIAPVGTIYRNQVSTPSIPEATVDANNNLNLLQFPNIALNKPATANSSYLSTSLPEKAVDGDATSSASLWAVNIGNAGNPNFTPLPAWIEVDLQGSFTIDSFRIYESSSASRNFNFQVWDATLNAGAGGWSNALTVTGNPASSLTTYRTIDPITTTKVRIFITAHNSTTLLRMFELEVYGKVATNLSLQQYQKPAFALFPNPVVDGILTITGDTEIKSVAVFDVRGVETSVPYDNRQLSVHNLAKGVYFLKINNNNTIKFIKQ
jgi:hypothetical protein